MQSQQETASAKTALSFSILQRQPGSPSHCPAPITHLKTTLQVGSGPLLVVPALYVAVPVWGQVDPQPRFKPVDSWVKASPYQHSSPSAHGRVLLLWASPCFSALLSLWLGALLSACGAGDSTFWVAEPVSMRKCLCRALPWASHGRDVVPAGRCQCRKGICIFDTSWCCFTASEQLPGQIRLPHTYSRLPPRSC